MVCLSAVGLCAMHVRGCGTACHAGEGLRSLSCTIGQHPAGNLVSCFEYKTLQSLMGSSLCNAGNHDVVPASACIAKCNLLAACIMCNAGPFQTILATKCLAGQVSPTSCAVLSTQWQKRLVDAASEHTSGSAAVLEEVRQDFERFHAKRHGHQLGPHCSKSGEIPCWGHPFLSLRVPASR